MNLITNMNLIKQYKLRLAVVIPLLTSCGSPLNVNVDLPESMPETKTTTFNKAVNDLGTMSAIYTDVPLRIMANDIKDNTGTSAPTSGEIPNDITNMVKSTLNGFGGNIIFIPYDPGLMSNNMNLGYSQFENKIIPDVIIDGGITEFDRGLETQGDSINMALDGTVNDKQVGVDFEDSNKVSVARVTLDFNLIDFQTFSGIPQMQAINTIKLHKAVKKDSIGFTILSSTFGTQGSIKKIQGRHAAIRLLVQLSMLQIVGKYQDLPYWRLLPGSERDVKVLERVEDRFYQMPDKLKTGWFQIILALNGYPVQVTGIEDHATITAKKGVIQKYQLAANSSNVKAFLAAYENIPITRENKYKSQKLFQQLQHVLQSSDVAVTEPVTPEPAPVQEPQSIAGNINLVTNKTSYNIGEKMNVRFTVDEPMYVRVAVVSSDGSVATLFPNAFQNDNYCMPGVTYQIPPSGSSDFSLDIGEPRGIDRIRAVGSLSLILPGQINYSHSGQLDESKFREKIITAGTDITIQ
jgi:hypothetical protein